MDAGGMPIIAPDVAPKMMTKAKAGAKVVACVHNTRMRTDPKDIALMWTFSVPNLEEAY